MAEKDEQKPFREPDAPEGDWAGAFSRIATITVIVGVFVALLAVLWYSVHVLLLVFGGILFAVFLSAVTDALASFTRMPRTAALGIVVVTLLALFVGFGTLMFPYVAEQIDQMRELIPDAVEEVRSRIAQYQWGEALLERVPSPQELGDAPMRIWLGAFGALGWLTSILTGALVIFFVGIYSAADPKLYSNGVVRLTPMSYRPQMRELLGRLAQTLRWWLIGQSIAMVFIAIVTTTGLWLLGVPLAPLLGVISGVLSFVPTFGPIAGSLLPILLAFTVSPVTALYVVVFYIIVETVEGYVLTPMIQQRIVELPKVIAITFQILMLLLVGPLGLILGHPLAAVTMVIVEQVYVRDTLGDRSADIPGD